MAKQHITTELYGETISVEKLPVEEVVRIYVDQDEAAFNIYLTRRDLRNLISILQETYEQ